MIQWRRIQSCFELCRPGSRQLKLYGSRVQSPGRQLEHKTRTRDTVAAVKQSHKHDSKAGAASTLTDLVSRSLPFVFVFPSRTNHCRHSDVIFSRLTNLNLIKCLGQPNFINLALPTTLATRQEFIKWSSHSLSVSGFVNFRHAWNHLVFPCRRDEPSPFSTCAIIG